MALPLSNTFDGGSDGTTITIGNSGGGSGDAFDVVNAGGTSTMQFETSTSMHGGVSAQYNLDGSNVTYLGWNATSMGAGTETEIWARFYMFRSATPTEQHRIARAWNNSSTELMRFSWHTDAKLYLFDSTLAVPPASSFTLTANQWLRFELHILCSATVGELEAKAYVGDSETAIGTYTRTGLNTLTDVSQIGFGNTVAAAPGDPFWIDSITVNNTGYPGPAGSPPGDPLRIVRSGLRW